jgi:hypothetical protein
VHSADGWEAVLKPVVARYQGAVERIAFRGDAAFAQPNMYDFLGAEGIEYAIRLPANQFSKRESAIYSNVQLGDRRIMLNDSTRAFTTRRRVGPIRVGSSPKWNGISENCSPASALSSPT